ncbi:MAG: hypothetical protein NTW32_18040 [Chloroflexi bacterium]|nr:hypothetical protein [Chloroflexota bacterium]
MSASASIANLAGGECIHACGLYCSIPDKVVANITPYIEGCKLQSQVTQAERAGPSPGYDT